MKVLSKHEKGALNLYHDIYLSHFKYSKMWHIFVALAIVFILAFILYNYLFFTVVLSNSMKPTFERGDMILMQGYDTTPQIGDIAMFTVIKFGKDDLITHRIYSISGNKIKTKGDAGQVDKWTITPKNIHSKAIIIGGKPIVIKSVGYYFLDDTPTSTYEGEFGFIQSIIMKAKELGLLIFAIAIILFVLLSVNDSVKQKQLRRRN